MLLRSSRWLKTKKPQARRMIFGADVFHYRRYHKHIYICVSPQPRESGKEVAFPSFFLGISFLYYCCAARLNASKPSTLDHALSRMDRNEMKERMGRALGPLSTAGGEGAGDFFLTIFDRFNLQHFPMQLSQRRMMGAREGKPQKSQHIPKA